MSNYIDVAPEESYESPTWIDRVEPFTQRILKELHIDNWELSILFCNDDFMQKLNMQYRNIESPTDVLSFEQGDEYIDDAGITRFSAGDIVISMDSVHLNAQEFGISDDEELKRVIIHGVLHLKGFDHADNDPTQSMLIMQEQLLISLSDSSIAECIIEDKSK